MMKKFADHVYVSGYDSVHDDALLRSLGITAIVNVAFDVSDPEYPMQDFSMVKIGLQDGPDNPNYMKELAVSTVLKFLEEGKTVLVHCAAGASRSPYIACCAIAIRDNKTLDQVYDEVIAKYGEGEAFRHTPLRTNTYIPIGAE